MRHFLVLAAIAAAIAAALGAGPCEPVAPDAGNGGEATLEPLADQEGWGVSGPHGFNGTLLWTEDEAGAVWPLEGAFTIPTAGYAVAAPEISVMKSLPEQVRIVLTVTPPPPDAMVAQVITNVPVAAEIAVSRNALFSVEVMETAPGAP